MQRFRVFLLLAMVLGCGENLALEKSAIKNENLYAFNAVYRDAAFDSQQDRIVVVGSDGNVLIGANINDAVPQWDPYTLSVSANIRGITFCKDRFWAITNQAIFTFVIDAANAPHDIRNWERNNAVGADYVDIHCHATHGVLVAPQLGPLLSLPETSEWTVLPVRTTLEDQSGVVWLGDRWASGFVGLGQQIPMVLRFLDNGKIKEGSTHALEHPIWRATESEEGFLFGITGALDLRRQVVRMNESAQEMLPELPHAASALWVSQNGTLIVAGSNGMLAAFDTEHQRWSSAQSSHKSDYEQLVPIGPNRAIAVGFGHVDRLSLQ